MDDKIVVQEGIIEDTTEKLGEIKKSLEVIVENIESTINLILNNWQSEASTQLAQNMRKSMESFNSYIKEIDDSITYLNETGEEVEQLES